MRSTANPFDPQAQDRWPAGGLSTCPRIDCGMPDVPTAIESGQLKKKASTWFAVSAPAHTPQPTIDRLNREIIKASQDPDLAARLQQSGVLTRTSTPDRLRELTKIEVETIGPLVKSLGMAPN